MNVRPIISLGHPVLRQQARRLTLAELKQPATQALIDDLIATMRHAHGAGLAANQVGEPVQICVLEVNNNPRYPYKPNIPLTILVNPSLTPLSNDTFENFEGCLSVPKLRGRVLRHAHIKVRAWDRQGVPVEFEARGLTAGTYQHEVDHLQGTLFVDRLVDSTSLCTWENYDAYERERFEREARLIVETWGS